MSKPKPRIMSKLVQTSCILRSRDPSLHKQLLSAEPIESDPEGVSLSSKDAEELDLEEELDAICIENGSCDERRLLIDSVDYKNDGPNNPITDPPPK